MKGTKKMVLALILTTCLAGAPAAMAQGVSVTWSGPLAWFGAWLDDLAAVFFSDETPPADDTASGGDQSDFYGYIVPGG